MFLIELQVEKINLYGRPYQYCRCTRKRVRGRQNPIFQNMFFRILVAIPSFVVKVSPKEGVVSDTEPLQRLIPPKQWQ